MQMTCLAVAVMTVLGGTSVLRTLKVLRKLGNGNFGSVYEVQGTGPEAGKTMACKQMTRTPKGIADYQHVKFDQLGQASRHACFSGILIVLFACAGSFNVEEAWFSSQRESAARLGRNC